MLICLSCLDNVIYLYQYLYILPKSNSINFPVLFQLSLPSFLNLSGKDDLDDLDLSIAIAIGLALKSYIPPLSDL